MAYTVVRVERPKGPVTEIEMETEKVHFTFLVSMDGRLAQTSRTRPDLFRAGPNDLYVKRSSYSDMIRTAYGIAAENKQFNAAKA